jgi:hypothetical protein
MLTIQKFREFVGNGVFTVTFLKKDGTLRTMNARLGVAKYVLGTQPEVTAKRKATLTAQNMIGVFEMPKIQYRTINLDTIKVLSANGVTLTF